jgi:hypothetical protein
MNYELEYEKTVANKPNVENYNGYSIQFRTDLCQWYINFSKWFIARLEKAEEERPKIIIPEPISEKLHLKMEEAAYMYFEAWYGKNWAKKTTERQIQDFVSGWKYGIANPTNQES